MSFINFKSDCLQVQLLYKQRYKVKRKIIIVILVLTSFNGFPQISEKFALFTDRDVYASGETLLLKVFATEAEQSGVVNIDLLTGKGMRITHAILKITGDQADGFIYIPDSLSSGCYFVGTSTRTNKTHTLKEIYIANRFADLPESNAFSRPVVDQQRIEKPIPGLRIQGIESRYKPREKGHFTIALPDECRPASTEGISVTIATTLQEYNGQNFFVNRNSPVSPITDKEGIILEGVVRELQSDHPFKNGVVYLSIPDSIPGFNYYITGSDGRFYFLLKDYHGKVPIVIQAFDKAERQLVRISLNEPATIPVDFLTFETRNFSTEFRRCISQNTSNVTFRKIFNQPEVTIQTAPLHNPDPYPFYGVATTTVFPKLFTDLPDFSEVSRELLPGVKFRTYNRLPVLLVNNSAQQNFFLQPPLLLLDGIPIHDLNLIKSMGSKEIDNVEICQSERFFGDLSFPGVIAIRSSKPDYSRPAVSDELIKLNLDAIQLQTTSYTPSELPFNEPDLRQVLLWKPSLKPEGKLEMDFQTSDICGHYKVVIRGKSANGEIYCKEQFFEVK